MKKIGAIQSNYIPWRGYFDFIRRVDEFFLYDCVQYTPQNWRNRNRIQTKDGVRWLTIPVQHQSSKESVCDKRIADPAWNTKHWNQLRCAYARAPYFSHYSDYIESLYLASTDTRLSQVNLEFLNGLKPLLKIDTPLIPLTQFTRTGDKNRDLVQLCLQAKADIYLTGPTTRGYIDETLFHQAGIQVEWMTYDYPDYHQLYSPFDSKVSVLDLLFNEGPGSERFLGPVV